MQAIGEFFIRHPALFIFGLLASIGIAVALVTGLYDASVKLVDRVKARRARRKAAPRIEIERRGSERFDWR